MKNITPVIAAQTRSGQLPPELPGKLRVNIRQLRTLGFFRPDKDLWAGKSNPGYPQLFATPFQHTAQTESGSDDVRQNHADQACRASERRQIGPRRDPRRRKEQGRAYGPRLAACGRACALL